MAETSDTDALTRSHIDRVLRAFEDRDTAEAAEFWAEDGVFIDPHYPEPEYRGRDEIREALDWALENIVEQPGLDIQHLWEDDGTFAVEVATHHTMKDGTEADFPQVFIVEGEQGQITRWQSYLPFPPPDAA